MKCDKYTAQWRLPLKSIANLFYVTWVYIPPYAYVLCAGLLVLFFVIQSARHKELKNLKKFYSGYEIQDTFIESLIGKVSLQGAAIAYGVLFALFFTAIYHLNSAYDRGTSKYPGGVQQIETEMTYLRRDMETLKAEKESALQELARYVGDSDMEATVNNVKGNYRNLFINYFYLENCNAANAYESAALASMMTLELNNYKATIGDIWDGVNAARAYFKQHYINSPCDKEALEQIATIQRKYVDVAIKNLQAEFSLNPPTRLPGALFSNPAQNAQAAQPIARDANQQVVTPEPNAGQN